MTYLIVILQIVCVHTHICIAVVYYNVWCCEEVLHKARVYFGYQLPPLC